MKRLENKVVLITGGALGIGRASAELFASHGARVFAADVRNPDPYVGGIEFLQLDVTQEEEWKAAVAEVVSQAGRIDGLLNNAGIISYEPLHETTMESWHRTIAVNQTGVWLGMKHVIPVMAEGGGGSIVNFSSIWGSVATPAAHAYHASKGAVLNMTRSGAVSYAQAGIRVNTVSPGLIKTPMTEAQDPAIFANTTRLTPMGRPGDPIDIANACLYLVSDESSYVTGAEIAVDGGFLAQ